MDLSKIYPTRPEWSRKGNFGSVLIVCGSKLYTGAAVFAGAGALRAGADLVTICSPQRSADAAAHFMPDFMTFPLKGDQLSARNLPDIFDTAHLRKINSAVIGCGLGRKVTTYAAICKLISKLNIPMVLDADGLRAIATKPSVVHGKHAVLTPHTGELAVLLNPAVSKAGQDHTREVFENFEARLVAAKQVALKYQAVVLVKGYVDIITDGNSTITNNSGTPFMTKGGFGDVLAGIVGALLSRGVGLFEAAHAAAYINGKAGELAAEKKGESLAASDIFAYIPKVIN